MQGEYKNVLSAKSFTKNSKILVACKKQVLKHCITTKNKTIYFQSYLKVCGFEMSLGLFQ